MHVTNDDATRTPAEFGARLRSLRRAAGLSQTDLATEGLSPSYVSLIESGKRPASAAVIAILAGRLGVDEQFLTTGVDAEASAALELDVAYAEIALRNGDGQQALTHAATVVAAAAHAVAPEVRNRARRLHAEALEAVGNLEAAIRELEPLRVEATEARRWLDELRLTLTLARCHKELGDLRHALTLATDAMERAVRLELTGSDVHAELSAMVIGLHYLLGDLARADLLADDVLAQLEETGSRHARGSVYWNASLNAHARGQHTKALTLAERALALYAEDDDERGLARLRNAYAWLLLRADPPRPDKARELLERSREVLVDTGSAVDRAYAETELARAHLLMNDTRQAVRLATSALRRLGDEPRHQTAHAHLVIARAKLLAGDSEHALAEYRDAAKTLTRLQLGRQAAEAWRELADAFTSLGKFEDAANAYQRALAEIGVAAAPAVVGPPAAAPAGGAVPLSSDSALASP
jgi:transcriptional regulator with XRE-family HTH domain